MTTTEQQKIIARLHKRGFSVPEIQNITGLSDSSISKYLNSSLPVPTVRRRRLTATMYDQIMQARDEGQTLEQISNMCGYSITQLTRIVKQPRPVFGLHDIEIKTTHKWSDQQKAQVIELLEQGVTDRQIATAFGVHHLAIAALRNRHNLTRDHDLRGWFSVYDLQTFFGLGSRDSILDWISAGWLPFQWVTQDSTFKRRIISHNHLRSFLQDDRYWHHWDEHKITEDSWRAWVRDIRKDFRLYSTNEAAMKIGVAPVTLRQWIAAGLITTRICGPGKRHMLTEQQVKKLCQSYQWGCGLKEAA